MIQETTWYLGGWNTSEIATNMYEKERGTTVVQNPSDGVMRTTQWTGLIDLMYPSDFGYGASATCSTRLNLDEDDEYFEECASTSWIYHGYYEWYITPTLCNSGVLCEHESGSEYAYNNYAVRPTLYLKPNVVVTGGNGSSNTPYTVQLAS